MISPRLCLLPLALGLSCVAINPAYSDSEASDAAGATGSTSRATGGDSRDDTGHSGGGTGSTSLIGEPSQWLFTDDEAAEFEAGRMQELTWSDESDALTLSDNEDNGRIVSRVFATDGRLAQLVRLEWDPIAPYGVGMFDPGLDELGDYDHGGANLEALDLLLRFDGQDGPLNVGDTVFDSSGYTHDGVVGGAPLSRIAGVFREGLSNPGPGFIAHPPAELAPGADEFTWTAWFRSDECNGTSLVTFDAPNDQSLGTHSVWLTCARGSICPEAGPPEFGTLQAGAFFIDGDGASLGPHACGNVQLDDDIWHAVALRFRREGAGSQVEVFVDGAPDGIAVPSNAQFDYASGAPQTFSTLGNPSAEYDGAGDFDEVALWRRALDASELRALYNRGTTDVTVRVRACSKPDCSDEPPFVGRDSGGRFRDSGPDREHGHHIEESDLVGVAFQYELTMARRPGNAEMPQVPRVSMLAVASDG